MQLGGRDTLPVCSKPHSPRLGDSVAMAMGIMAHTQESACIKSQYANTSLRRHIDQRKVLTQGVDAEKRVMMPSYMTRFTVWVIC